MEASVSSNHHFYMQAAVAAAVAASNPQNNRSTSSSTSSSTSPEPSSPLLSSSPKTWTCNKDTVLPMNQMSSASTMYPYNQSAHLFSSPADTSYYYQTHNFAQSHQHAHHDNSSSAVAAAWNAMSHGGMHHAGSTNTSFNPAYHVPSTHHHHQQSRLPVYSNYGSYEINDAASSWWAPKLGSGGIS